MSRVAPSERWAEDIAPGEAEEFDRLARVLVGVREPDSRALHAKVHGAARVTFTVRDDVPAFARQGIFAEARSYRGVARFSNGGRARKPDAEPDLRGLAMKLVEVDGPKELGSARTQDLLFVDAERIPFRTPAEFVTVIDAARTPATALFKLLGGLGLRTFGLLGDVRRVVLAGPPSLADLRYHGVGPLKCGPFAMRLHLTPLHVPSSDAVQTHATRRREPDYLGAELRERLRRGALEFKLSAQFFESNEGEPIEDTTRVWKSEAVDLATIRLTAASESLAARVEQLSFDPWHCLKEHRPLGATQRARKHAYFASIQARGAASDDDTSYYEELDASR